MTRAYNLAAILVGLFLLISTANANLLPVAFINEIHYDNQGVDVDEFVEILVPVTTDLHLLSLLLVNGGNGKVYQQHLLSSGSAQQITAQWQIVTLTLNGIQNGSPDGLALVYQQNTLLQFLSYEGTFVGEEGILQGVQSQDIGIMETSSTAVGTSMQLTGDGEYYGQFVWQAGLPATAGQLNLLQQLVMPKLAINIVNEPATTLIYILALVLFYGSCTMNRFRPSACAI